MCMSAQEREIVRLQAVAAKAYMYAREPLPHMRERAQLQQDAAVLSARVRRDYERAQKR